MSQCIYDSATLSCPYPNWIKSFGGQISQGIAVAERENPDLVILDMMMPKRSGFLVLEKLRREYGHPIHIIMVTANEGNRHRAYAEMLGVDDYIRKPFAMERLLESVQKLLA